MDPERSAVYCTLLLSDHYLPGAMVLAHSLRDSGTRARLVALFTPDKLHEATINELQTVYDELIPVHSIVNDTPANLWLMDRPDLIATFTKIELWRLTQYERIVYIDCDVVAVRAPDELFSLQVDFAAAPDVGWPDCFNSGLMALHPNLQDYHALKAFAERGISFDGADQGLLNMHFRDWHRLSFSYNCTPSANYQYIPAYKHFQSTISLIHFIGSQKPWNLPRQVVPLESPYNQLLGKWWAVYDRHYQPPFVSVSTIGKGPPPQVHHEQTSMKRETPSVSGHQLRTVQLAEHPETSYEQWPQAHHVYHVEEGEPVSFHHEEIQSGEDVPALVSSEEVHAQHLRHQHQYTEHHWEHHHDHSAPYDVASAVKVPVLSAVPQYVRGEEHVSTFIPPLPYAPAFIAPENQQSYEAQQEMQHNQTPDLHGSQTDQPQAEVAAPPPAAEPHHRAPSPEPTFQAPQAEWDASREPPPLHSKPEGISLEQKTYTMSEDTSLFQPPPSYPEAPKNMYYQVPETKPEPEKVAQLFPWESRAPKPTRVFAHEQPVPRVESPKILAVPESGDYIPSPETLPPRAPYEPSADSWEHYSRSNAWDEDPDIRRYIESMQQVRRARTQVVSGSTHTSSSASSHHRGSPSSSSTISTITTGLASEHRPSIRLTDFPTEVERPSLPVTPAPIQRNRGTSGGGKGNNTSGGDAFPVAGGVPDQEDWVGVTVDAFSHLLRATYLLWRSTESPGPTGTTAPSAVPGFGESRTSA
ncbi:uncharacterized protein N7459_002750 [Penicillium hispanicum]|uniref:uncharacterized protein n=1 Tax=Penicillium hispanicum TaxID=1080232 RepID=UPI002542204A|nr:uncharacterized protein N7459_002750 [Penicillium hispanicum]KAJ5586985.1 hypothetical protein N7459_002750 [Penicillium hispanicum]